MVHWIPAPFVNIQIVFLGDAEYFQSFKEAMEVFVSKKGEDGSAELGSRENFAVGGQTV
mgnify:CR=1 FL=1